MCACCIRKYMFLAVVITAPINARNGFGYKPQSKFRSFEDNRLELWQVRQALVAAFPSEWEHHSMAS